MKMSMGGMANKDEGAANNARLSSAGHPLDKNELIDWRTCAWEEGLPRSLLCQHKQVTGDLCEEFPWLRRNLFGFCFSLAEVSGMKCHRHELLNDNEA